DGKGMDNILSVLDKLLPHMLMRLMMVREEDLEIDLTVIEEFLSAA
ncbi:MAG: hypothetical protein GY817_08075, partial [bacterium]|nr:hypothetical protein [bacterium]MCP4482689.1 hypothetical protein [bacterium]